MVVLLPFAWPGFELRLGLHNREMVTLGQSCHNSLSFQTLEASTSWRISVRH